MATLVDAGAPAAGRAAARGRSTQRGRRHRRVGGAARLQARRSHGAGTQARPSARCRRRARGRWHPARHARGADGARLARGARPRGLARRAGFARPQPVAGTRLEVTAVCCRRRRASVVGAAGGWRAVAGCLACGRAHDKRLAARSGLAAGLAGAGAKPGAARPHRPHRARGRSARAAGRCGATGAHGGSGRCRQRRAGRSHRPGWWPLCHFVCTGARAAQWRAEDASRRAGRCGSAAHRARCQRLAGTRRLCRRHRSQPHARQERRGVGRLAGGVAGTAQRGLHRARVTCTEFIAGLAGARGGGARARRAQRPVRGDDPRC